MGFIWPIQGSVTDNTARLRRHRHTNGSRVSANARHKTKETTIGGISQLKYTFKPAREERIAGLLLGTAIGDALGLPAEGLHPPAIARLGWKQNWHHRLIGNRGMWSDDTEHTIMLCQALMASRNDPSRFARCLGWELRWWSLGLPAGIGFATARAILRLWLGFSPRRAGVFSAGNGPCMRTAVIGACFPDDQAMRRAFTEAHTRLTHSDPKALIATLAVTELAALLAAASTPPSPETIAKAILPHDAEADWRELVEQLLFSWDRGESFGRFLDRIGVDSERGISGYVYQTVPAVIYVGATNGWKFRETISVLLDAGGDTDTVGAIAGALCGAFGGEQSLPDEWIDGIAEWPTGISSLRRLAAAIATGESLRVRPYWSLPQLLRNLLFLTVIAGHCVVRVYLRICRK